MVDEKVAKAARDARENFILIWASAPKPVPALSVRVRSEFLMYKDST